MGIMSLAKSSLRAQGSLVPGMPYSPHSEKSMWTKLSGAAAPTEGLLHSTKRGILESFGFETSGKGLVLAHGNDFVQPLHHVKYGGGVFSSGGLNEIMHTTEQIGKSGMYKLGARRSLAGMLGRGAMKALGPAMFIYSAATEGIGSATKNAIVTGAAWGAGRWAIGQMGMAIASPFTIAAAAVTGMAVGGRAALRAGREYNRNMRKFSLGNAMPDTYGTIATMRQASVQAIQSSRLNGRSCLGAEAQLLHY